MKPDPPLQPGVAQGRRSDAPEGRQSGPPEGRRPATPQGRHRRRDAEASRAAILQAAREVFAERGYARATIRAIAGRAGVTHGLVMRHFGSKEQLLVAALPGTSRLPEFIPGDPATLAQRIAAGFVDQIESSGDHALIALIRSAAAGDETPVRLYRALERSAAQAFSGVLSGPDAEVYVDLLASLFIGVTFSRYVAGAGALAEMSADELIGYLTAAIGALLAPALSPST